MSQDIIKHKKCRLCSFSCLNTKTLRNHYRDVHGIRT
jgi:hypothetical protein